ncbi:tyrosine-type recombinase/integrase [Dactylosporangium roseum]|uniref:Tyrosine-type recombinase/integrase n=1 Tax=Dactylosporangium roseum TaxID=47989 RepID=A0ABY5Z6V6_9ACTN|nr:tyrosine-type recombinase/integrase [Dactylosporangium roseum]UWZ36793.1 tyrosine-type recombinase/integrase [Dactylosporangium roseum]
MTEALEWLARQLGEGKAKSSIKLYFELLDAICAAAVADRVMPNNPCAGVRLSKVLNGVSRAPKWIPAEDQVLRLLDVIPPSWEAAVRPSEAIGVEEDERCFDLAEEELHVVQQLRYSPRTHGGFYLSGAKSGSSGTVDLDAVVAEKMRAHTAAFPPVELEMLDITSGEPRHRTVRLLFRHAPRESNNRQNLVAGVRAKWRAAAGWPDVEHAGFHTRRHFFATTLISQHVEPQEVQRVLRHKMFTMTLEAYVHRWPKGVRQCGVIGAALPGAVARL